MTTTMTTNTNRKNNGVFKSADVGFDETYPQRLRHEH